MLGGIFALNVTLAVYLSENIRDLIRIFLGLPLLILIFDAGIVNFWFNVLNKPLSTFYSES